jgi:NAD(P)-dependent dehydrogenase (short-subunit alcohol dehydrogenase family)
LKLQEAHNVPNSELVGKTAIITGAGRGIGHAIARLLARKGASVLLVDNNRELGEQAARELGGETGSRVEPFAADVTIREDVAAAVEHATSTLGPVDILVNNAGVWYVKSFLETSDDEFDRTLAVSLRGSWLFMKAVAPGMVQRRRGAIVNIVSVAAFTFTVSHAPYAAAKAGLAALTRDVAFELAPHGVRVNAVAPGTIFNPARGAEPGPATAGLPMGHGTGDDIAGAVGYLVSDAARYVTGITIPVAGGGNLSVAAGWR